MIKELESRLGALERDRKEPIAIVGIGCRIPGGGLHPEGFWQTLKEGTDAVRAIPADRWPPEALPEEQPGIGWAGLLDAVDGFDAPFFEISPREAVSLDPQQRLLLEVSWEALENAGIRPDRLIGSNTGVFLGISSLDYRERVASRSLEQQDVYAVTGNAQSTAAGRLSYVLGLEGPCLSVDTACSSSLVAVHLACQSLRMRECDVALAGGVNVILSPLTMYAVARTQALSPDGRCKTFDAAANGFVRGEGSGIVALKRLSDAERDGDRIWALIRGSAMNQDGRSTGLTAPNVLSQQALLRTALANAGVLPSQVGYIEAHGTGTSLGDPIEFEALKEVLGRPRTDGSICALGSVKTNIGHLEAAAGIAGLIKAVLALANKTIPRHLHFQTLNPRISLEGTPFVIPVAELPWSAGDAPRIAGVSSFGISGTNAHVVLEEAPRIADDPPAAETSALVLPLSAKSPTALLALAEAYRAFITQNASVPLRDVAYTASVLRPHHAHRLAVVGRSREELCAALDAIVRDEPMAGVARDEASSEARPRVVFVYSGQGSQWVGMGRKLLAEEPVFRAAIEACEPLVKLHAGFSLLEELNLPEESSRLQETEVAQPVLFALQVGLSELWRSWGVEPSAVVGHSVGEVTAAHMAGALSLPEAVRLVCCRGRVMQKATGLGKMASVRLSMEAAREALQGDDRVAIAAINDPETVVLAGQSDAMAEIMSRLTGQGVECRALRVNYAFHSPTMAPLANELVDALGALELRPAKRSMYSTVRGERMDGHALEPGYWATNLRSPVAFAPAIDAAIRDGHHIFVEVGPHPVLTSHIEQCLRARDASGHVAYSMRRDREERTTMLSALGALYAAGYPVEWKRLYPSGGRTVSLPTYPWQRQRYWIEAAATTHVTADGQEKRGGAQEGGKLGAPRVREALLQAAPSERPALLKTRIAEEISRVLLLPDAEIDSLAPFRSLGMDSLMMLELRNRLEACLGLKISATALLAYPDLTALCEHLLGKLGLRSLDGEPSPTREPPSSRPLVDEKRDQTSAKGWSPLVLFQPEGQGRPIFFVHFFGGAVGAYADIARHMGKARPFYTLQAQGFEDGLDPLDRFEDMAAQYIRAMREVQPEGPYLLGGWSFGGILAFEMAHQLLGAGQAVASVTMLDSPCPDDPTVDFKAAFEEAGEDVDFFIATTRRAGLRLSDDELAKVEAEAARTRGMAFESRRSVLAPSIDMNQIAKVKDAQTRALYQYKVRTYSGRITFFRANDPRLPMFGHAANVIGDPLPAWQRHCSQPIEAYDAPGNHVSMGFEPHAQGLAAKIAQCLLAVDPPGSP